jgi:hypothetical protein
MVYAFTFNRLTDEREDIQETFVRKKSHKQSWCAMWIRLDRGSFYLGIQPAYRFCP